MTISKRLLAAIYLLMASILSAPVMADLVVVVSVSNEVGKLTSSQLAGIFLGRQRQFPSGGVAIPVDQAEGLPIRNEFYSRYLGRSAAQIRAHWAKLIFTGRGRPPQTVANGAEMAKFVAQHPGAIGYLAPNLVDDQLKVVTIE